MIEPITTNRMKLSFGSIAAKLARTGGADAMTALTYISPPHPGAQCYAKSRGDYVRESLLNSTSPTPTRIKSTATATLRVIFSPSSVAPSTSATRGLTSA